MLKFLIQFGVDKNDTIFNNTFSEIILSKKLSGNCFF